MKVFISQKGWQVDAVVACLSEFIHRTASAITSPALSTSFCDACIKIKLDKTSIMKQL